MSAPRPQNYERAEDQTDASDKSPVSKLAKIRSSQGPLNQYHVYSVWQLARLSLCSVLLPRRRGPRLCVLCALAGISLLWLMLVIRNQVGTRFHQNGFVRRALKQRKGCTTWSTRTARCAMPVPRVCHISWHHACMHAGFNSLGRDPCRRPHRH